MRSPALVRWGGPVDRPFALSLPACCLLLLLAACQLSAQTAWQSLRPASPPRTRRMQNKALSESSGVAVSHSQPGILWSQNDSGNEPTLFALDTMGTDFGAVDVRGARNVDWEEIALGPCSVGRCIYIADTGDNNENRESVTLYRVPEPTLSRNAGALHTALAEAVYFRYPDGSHDVEAMYVDGLGDSYLISKGRTGAVLLYRIPAAAWKSRATAVAELLGPVPIPTARELGRLVTGAALSPDGEHVAVRTYRDVFVFRKQADGRLADQTHQFLDVRGFELQGEGVDWLDAHTFVLTGERAFGQASTVTVVSCPAALLDHSDASARR